MRMAPRFLFMAIEDSQSAASIVGEGQIETVPHWAEEERKQGMAKGKASAIFYCQSCGYESAKWMGQCPGCRGWNTFVEEPADRLPSGGGAKGIMGHGSRVAPTVLAEVSVREEDRLSTGIGELDRVLGGGIVQGSLTLVGGDPGIGKSTLLLQVCRIVSGQGHSVLYISGEESLTQIKMRADRIGEFSSRMLLLCETNLNDISEVIRSRKPEAVVIDSIQTMYNENVSSAPGSVSQVRESTSVLLQLAKGLGVSVFLVGHVTKEGTVAGPRVLEHMVDSVLYFEGERHASYRILRGVKNRFGSTNEIGVFEMQEQGLREVKNASEYMLGGRPENASGSVVVCTMEGTRPLLVEIQALVCHSSFGIPRRQAIGADLNRVNLLMAVLEKRLGMQLASCDAYVNITGGIKILEPAMDLGVVIAVLSSFKNCALNPRLAAFGEVGLSGEIRGVGMAKQRVAEAERLGFDTCILPYVCGEECRKGQGRAWEEGTMKIIGVKTVQDVMDVLF